MRVGKRELASESWHESFLNSRTPVKRVARELMRVTGDVAKTLLNSNQNLNRLMTSKFER